MPSVSKLREYLGGLLDLGARPQQEMHSKDFALERMHYLMEELHNPERAYPCLHIAGTNGKGSVSAFCTAALQAHGYRVGSFTSPHIAGALAGITIDQVIVPDADLEGTFFEILPALEKRDDWTQFEVVTALMFAHFARAQVDAAVIEVGLGGRLDATNVLSPLVMVITPIDYDHTTILGTTLAEIAGEKAGIIKEGVPVVMAPQPMEARARILQVAEEKRAPVIEVGSDVMYESLDSNINGQQFNVWEKVNPGKIHLAIKLLGRHQMENAVTALAALRVANGRGLQISDEAIARGFAAARWPGRFEIVRMDPPVVQDAAHSPAAAKALRAALDEYFPGRPVVMVLGVSADKDLTGVIEPLRERVTKAVATQSTHPRAMPAAELQLRLAQLGIQAEAETDATLALQKAIDSSTGKDVILVCGSVFLVETIEQLIKTEDSARKRI